LNQTRSATRRRILKIVGAFFLGDAGALPGALGAPRPDDTEKKALAAFLDTLLPRDALSGSASALQVDRDIWTFARGDERFRQLLALGCQWLDMTGGARFSALAPEQQRLIVDWMAHADWNQIPRRFYELVRQVALEFYYSKTAAWPGIAIDHPPQPLGYPPPWA